MLNHLNYEPVIGLEVHAELATVSKMFCACPVVDSTREKPNVAVCPVCSGMPGVLPVINQRAIEFGLRVALALQCEIPCLSIFARKNYFYPDLPKGYQISQYEKPLAYDGRLMISTPKGEREIRIERVHLEEDTGKLTHITREGESYSLIDLNRAGVPLLEIVSEPDIRSAEEARVYATTLHSLLRYLGVSSGDMEKGVLRIEPNISVREKGNQAFGTRVEIKNLNSFRALERSVACEIQRQIELKLQGQPVVQQTRGWDENRGETVLQRIKEHADDYRYFPEPDLPPLFVSKEWLEQIQASQPELPIIKKYRFESSYKLNQYDAGLLTAEPAIADFFEQVVNLSPQVAPKQIAHWITGELFGLLNQKGISINESHISPAKLSELICKVNNGEINQNIAKSVLEEMFVTGKSMEEIVSGRNLHQISDSRLVSELVTKVLRENPQQLATYISGKDTVAQWFFGQVMRATNGQANPQVLNRELNKQLLKSKGEHLTAKREL